MLGVLRDRGQAGRLVPDGDPAHRQRPVLGAVRAERGVGGCRLIAGFGFLAAEEPDRVIPVAGPAGPALPFPGRVNHVRANPARYRPSGSTLPMCPQRPCSGSATPRRPHPAVHTRCHHFPGASRQWQSRRLAYPGRPDSSFLAPSMKHLHSCLVNPSTGPVPWSLESRTPTPEVSPLAHAGLKASHSRMLMHWPASSFVIFEDCLSYGQNCLSYGQISSPVVMPPGGPDLRLWTDLTRGRCLGRRPGRAPAPRLFSCRPFCGQRHPGGHISAGSAAGSPTGPVARASLGFTAPARTPGSEAARIWRWR